jgi:hypothetical protein
VIVAAALVATNIYQDFSIGKEWRSEEECRRREACAGVSPAAVPIAALST